MSLPQQLAMLPRAASVVSRAVRYNAKSSNRSTFTSDGPESPGEAHFSIPGGRYGQYLDGKSTYLKFKVLNNASGADIDWDRSAWSIIDRIEVYSGSNLLSSCNDVGVLANILLDATVDANARACNLNATAGTLTNADGAAIANNTSKTFCIPLIDGVLGASATRLIPIGQSVADLRIIITLASGNQAFVTEAPATTVKYVLTDAEIVCSIVEINAGVQRQIDQEMGGKYTISTEMWRSYNGMVSAGDSVINQLIPTKVHSLKTLLTCARNADNVNKFNQKSLGDRASLNPSRWWYRVGVDAMPATPVMSTAEAYMELLKSQHRASDVAHATSITLAQWEATTSATADGRFVYALNTEVFSNASQNIESGVDTRAVNTFFESELAAPVPGAAAYVLTTFAHFDAYLTLGPDGLFVTTF